MSRATLDQVFHLITQLAPSERQQVALRLKSTTQFNGHATAPALNGVHINVEEDWLLEGDYYELARRGLMSAGAHVPLTQIKRFAPDWTTQSLATRELLIQRMGPGSVRTNVKLALGRVVAQALADYLSPVAPIGLKVLLTNVDKVPQAVDAAFPGYLEGGMLRYLVDFAGLNSG